jgi:hypothetical protein
MELIKLNELENWVTTLSGLLGFVSDGEDAVFVAL